MFEFHTNYARIDIRGGNIRPVSVVSNNMISIKVEVMMKFVLELLKVVETPR